MRYDIAAGDVFYSAEGTIEVVDVRDGEVIFTEGCLPGVEQPFSLLFFPTFLEMHDFKKEN